MTQLVADKWLIKMQIRCYKKEIEILNEFLAVIADNCDEYKKLSLYQTIKRQLTCVRSISNFSTLIADYNKQLGALGLHTISLPNDLNTLGSDKSSNSKTQKTSTSKKSSTLSEKDLICVRNKSSSQEKSKSDKEENKISKYDLINFFRKNAYTNYKCYHEKEKNIEKSREYDNSVSSPPSKNFLNSNPQL